MLFLEMMRLQKSEGPFKLSRATSNKTHVSVEHGYWIIQRNGGEVWSDRYRGKKMRSFISDMNEKQDNLWSYKL